MPFWQTSRSIKSPTSIEEKDKIEKYIFIILMIVYKSGDRQTYAVSLYGSKKGKKFARRHIFEEEVLSPLSGNDLHRGSGVL
jgi:hypothetical protein